MTADEVKDGLRRRHPAIAYDTGGPGPWTTFEEWGGIDLLAVSCWSSQGGYGRVGYEVKVSRSDYRRELLNPSKRALNVEWCNEFYFAVPEGLLTAEELAYEEPEWATEDFCRTLCAECVRGKVYERFIGPLPYDGYRYMVEAPCQNCSGKGYLAKSKVESEAPTLWVPRDVGLVVVDGDRTKVLKKAPRRKEVAPLDAAELGLLLRWVSIRPDPRHVELREKVAA